MYKTIQEKYYATCTCGHYRVVHVPTECTLCKCKEFTLPEEEDSYL